MFLIMLWSHCGRCCTCTTCVATTHRRGHLHAHGTWVATPVVCMGNGYHFIYFDAWGVWSVVTVHGWSAFCWCGTATTPAALSVWWSIHTVCHRRLCVSLCQRTVVSSDCHSPAFSSWEWVVWWYSCHASSHQLANADQYCDGNHRLWRHHYASVDHSTPGKPATEPKPLFFSKPNRNWPISASGKP